MVLAVQKGLNVSCLIEKATTILGNSAGGVTRQRHCQPNLPPTPDQNTWAPGAAMASLWATTLFFFFFFESHYHVFLHFWAILCSGWSFPTLCQKKFHWIFSAMAEFCKRKKKYICKTCRTWQPFLLHRGAQPVAAVFSKAERLPLPPPLILSRMCVVLSHSGKIKIKKKKTGYFHRN